MKRRFYFLWIVKGPIYLSEKWFWSPSLYLHPVCEAWNATRRNNTSTWFANLWNHYSKQLKVHVVNFVTFVRGTGSYSLNGNVLTFHRSFRGSKLLDNLWINWALSTLISSFERFSTRCLGNSFHWSVCDVFIFHVFYSILLLYSVNTQDKIQFFYSSMLYSLAPLFV